MAAARSGCFLVLCFFYVFFGFGVPLSAFKYFSTKTPYGWIHPADESDLEDKWFNAKVDDLMCSAVHTSIVVRHGTRFPGQDDVGKISEIYGKLKTDSFEKIPDLKTWKNQFPLNDKKSLAKLGKVELQSFGNRTAQRLFSLFAEEDIDSFRYIISSKERTRDSAQSFYEGFTRVLQEVEEDEDEYEPEVMDKLLRFHDLCEKYVKSVGENKTAMAEYYKFQEGDLVMATKKKVCEKLGVPEETLSNSDIRTIYLMCGYEKAIFDQSPWCQLFDEDDMKLLEYLGDLKHYYKNGPGHSITWRQACPLVSDIFYTMDDAIDALETIEGSEEEDGYIIGQFAFGHAETLGPLYAALGLFNDSEPLRADNLDLQAGRVFRTSSILPFAANLQLVLYECEAQPTTPDADPAPTYYLTLKVNEKDTPLPGCHGNALCPYAQVRERLKEQVDDCNFAHLCRVQARDEL